MVERKIERERLIRKGRKRPHACITTDRAKNQTKVKKQKDWCTVIQYPEEKFLTAKKKTNNKLNPDMTLLSLSPAPTLRPCIGYGKFLFRNRRVARVHSLQHKRHNLQDLNPGTLKETSVFCGTLPPPPKQRIFFLICIHIFLQQAHHLLPLQAELCCYQLEFIMALSLISKVLRDFGITTELGGHQMMWFKH